MAPSRGFWCPRDRHPRQALLRDWFEGLQVQNKSTEQASWSRDLMDQFINCGPTHINRWHFAGYQCVGTKIWVHYIWDLNVNKYLKLVTSREVYFFFLAKQR